MCGEAQEWGRWVVSNKGTYVVLVKQIELDIDEKRFYVAVDFMEDPVALAKIAAFSGRGFDPNKPARDKYKNLRRLQIPADIDMDI